ncbi:hypothetical protein [Actinophytocola sp.]|uniref:hypothetical protein n=1 Tax=Actinophytocola sp. TaxID=1872138 RepID=UPI00389AE7DD
MLVGVPRAVKNHEYRVAITPAGVTEPVHHGHDVLVETGAEDPALARGLDVTDGKVVLGQVARAPGMPPG